MRRSAISEEQVVRNAPSSAVSAPDTRFEFHSCDGVSAWVDCELWAEYDGGDHTIAVGRVLDLSADPARPPLLYYRGRYGLASEN